MKKFEMKREGTGIVDVDGMIGGGFPTGSVVGISGPPGVGKSIFSLHFVLEGARKGQRGVYVNLEEPRRNIDNMIRQFSFADEFFAFEKKGLIVVKCFDYNKYEKIREDLFEQVHGDKKIRRLIIDSFNCFFASNCDCKGNSGMMVRKMIMEDFYKLRRARLTTLLTLEKDEENANFNIPYLVDGIIMLDYLDLGTIERRISVPKMRWTNQCKDGRSYDIADEGIVVSKDGW